MRCRRSQSYGYDESPAGLIMKTGPRSYGGGPADSVGPGRSDSSAAAAISAGFCSAAELTPSGQREVVVSSPILIALI